MDDGTGHLIRPFSVIGMGAYGTVFKAFRLPKEYGDEEEVWRSHAKAVAVKETVFTEVADDITVVLKEVSYLSNLQHPNIVSYFTAFTNSGVTPVAPSPASTNSKGNEGMKASPSFSAAPSLCIVEELVEGASVAKVLKMTAEGQLSNVMSEVDIAAVLYDVLQALLYIHEGCRLVHRDIKPLNMLMDCKTASVKLCDFGTCADVSQQAGRYTVIGTIGWIAPEVLDSGMMDCRSGHVTSHSFPSDVWSLGVSALEMALPNIRKTALSEYIKDFSASSCSAQRTLESSRKSVLPMKISSERLRDFIACCLRKDPLVRSTVRQLLAHPLIVGSGVASAQKRQKRIGAILDAVKAANKSNQELNEKMNDDAIVLPQYAHSTLKKNRCMEAIAAIKREFFAAQAPLSEKSRVSHYAWCFPEHIARMSSSDEYRYMPTPLRQQGLGQVPSVHNPQGNARSTAPLKPIFDSVVLPATVDSQRVVLSLIRKYRKLAGANTADGWTEVDRRNEACYALDELACQNLKHERFIRLHDDLLRTFKATCMAIPDFAANFLSNFTQSLTVSDDDTQNLRQFIAYIFQLQKEDLMHTHRTQLETPDFKATAFKSSADAFARSLQPMNFVSAEDLLRFPHMPQSAGFMNASNLGDDAATGTMRQQQPLVNPSAYLFNTWLRRKRADILGPS
ncbi:putative STE20-like serine/threonine-protein kinase 2 [Trypanosoma cruzi]|nr:putative STE20-like serine/threonine-protein kinase 2 [Trypanosoma cruzi]